MLAGRDCFSIDSVGIDGLSSKEQAFESLNPVTQSSCSLELKCLRGCSHLSLELGEKLLVLATPVEVEEVTRLLDIVKVSDEDREKWFKKANVEAWNEMTKDQIGGVIGWLNKRMK